MDPDIVIKHLTDIPAGYGQVKGIIQYRDRIIVATDIAILELKIDWFTDSAGLVPRPARK